MKIRVSFIYTILCLVIILIFIKSIDNNKQYNKKIQEVKGIVMEIDDSNVVKAGLSSIGNQILRVKIITANYDGIVTNVINSLLGKLDFDNYYKVGDKLIVALKYDDNNNIVSAKAVDLYRQNYILYVFLIFVILLVWYSRVIGLKALFSFIATVFILWKILIPLLIANKNPLLVTTFILIILTAIILFSVAGFTKKGLVAFLGTIFGLAITLFLTVIIGNKLGLGGMTSPYAETIVFSGYFNLDMKSIFYATIIIGSSGAAMDIAMDISSACWEIKVKKPDICRKELLKSGFNVGRDVIGTMTTTLLLAYSGGYLTLFMLFQIRESSFIRIINMKIISAEIMRTLIGSIGLVIVAPLTGIIASWLFINSNSKHNLIK
ncbi:YibE/F family protein [Clostridiaceae bacterium M8S5]|nr:YibE/F family protein [Clostridiaceae bacterium M8S5]